jgi:hypothetical protein
MGVMQWQEDSWIGQFWSREARMAMKVEPGFVAPTRVVLGNVTLLEALTLCSHPYFLML